jgi:hypothetical protein
MMTICITALTVRHERTNDNTDIGEGGDTTLDNRRRWCCSSDDGHFKGRTLQTFCGALVSDRLSYDIYEGVTDSFVGVRHHDNENSRDANSKFDATSEASSFHFVLLRLLCPSL